jgi:hypothetical protein
MRQPTAVTRLARTFHQRLALLGWLMLAAWVIWWTINLIQGRTTGGTLTWINPAFGVDFANHTDLGVRTWMAGGDPYAERHLLYSYPPIALRLFEWTWLFSTGVSLRIWICVAAVFAALGAVAATVTRRELGLAEIPKSLAVATILFSFPVLFALDRANYDLWIVPLVAVAVALMRGRTATGDIIAGFLLAVAIWCKLYPGLLIFGVLALQRWRLAIWIAAFGLLIGLTDPPQLMRFAVNMKIQTDSAWALARAFPSVLPWNHPLPVIWRSLWAGTPLALLPGQVGTGLLLGPLLVWVSWQMYRCPDNERLSFPYFFWLVALGAFAPVVANDYNLAPLLLVVLAIWSRADRWVVHAAFAALLLWWQPIALPFVPGRVYLFIKLAGVIAAGYSLVTHAARLSKIGSSSVELKSQSQIPNYTAAV